MPGRKTSRVPPKYLGSLRGKARTSRAAEIRRRNKETKTSRGKSIYRPFRTDVGQKTRPSGYTLKFKKKFGEVRGGIPGIARATHKKVAPRSRLKDYERALRTIYNRGKAAWATGHRPGATQQQWGYARVYSFILGGKTRHSADADQARKLGLRVRKLTSKQRKSSKGAIYPNGRWYGSKEAAFRRFGDYYATFTVGVALGKTTPEQQEQLAQKERRLIRLGYNLDQIESLKRQIEDELGPGPEKLTGVDVRRQGRLFENPYIELSKGKRTLVDDRDYERLSKHDWYYGFRGYAMRSKRMPNGRRKTVSMHREILGVGPDQEVDHINGDKLDNRRSNLRTVSKSANLHNRSAYGPSKVKGVSWDKRKKKWRAEIGKNGRRFWLGYHDTKAAANAAYRSAARKLYPGRERSAR